MSKLPSSALSCVGWGFGYSDSALQLERSIRNIALIGFMGSGKSSVGHAVAALLDFRYVDTDDLIERQAGRSISEIFASDGEPAFRDLERHVVDSLDHLENAVIATGGGVGANESHLANLKRHALTVCLWASPEVIWERVAHQNHRPLLHDPDPLGRIHRLLAEREPIYRRADVLISTERRSVKEIAHQVVYQFRQARSPAPGA